MAFFVSVIFSIFSVPDYIRSPINNCPPTIDLLINLRIASTNFCVAEAIAYLSIAPKYFVLILSIC